MPITVTPLIGTIHHLQYNMAMCTCRRTLISTWSATSMHLLTLPTQLYHLVGVTLQRLINGPVILWAHAHYYGEPVWRDNETKLYT